MSAALIPAPKKKPIKNSPLKNPKHNNPLRHRANPAYTNLLGNLHCARNRARGP
jgi:hypothetical protein